MKTVWDTTMAALCRVDDWILTWPWWAQAVGAAALAGAIAFGATVALLTPIFKDVM